MFFIHSKRRRKWWQRWSTLVTAEHRMRWRNGRGSLLKIAEVFHLCKVEVIHVHLTTDPNMVQKQKARDFVDSTQDPCPLVLYQLKLVYRSATKRPLESSINNEYQ
ncbi:hypothetical protein Tsp_10320 [Trichinella spiralis]|uniref:hypothetical protein n=1 Tax=Trichinella spiralis TaxID=6334 RepID=UPI0001EFE371|nr:hypothetical protein Tsp_10320 [Trichinella spiralis]